VTPGTGLPSLSLITPRIEPVCSWARIEELTPMNRQKINKSFSDFLINQSSFSEFSLFLWRTKGKPYLFPYRQKEKDTIIIFALVFPLITSCLEGFLFF
jgi:hypothetical protein